MRVSFRIAGLAMSMFWMACASGGGNAGNSSAPSVDVRVGADAMMAASHDVTMEGLNAGRMDYSIEGTDGRIYAVTLDGDQVKDLLDGSTVMADGTGPDGQTETIRIGVNQPSKKGSFGW